MRKCKHARAVRVWMVEVETYACVKCGAKGVRRLGKADEPHVDISAACFVTIESPFQYDWNLYLNEGGSLSIVSGHQDNGWGWDPSRTIASQIDECMDEYYSAAAEKFESMFVIDDHKTFETAQTYETKRAADPDCRDEDDEVSPVHEIGAKDPNEDALRDRLVMERDQLEVCACTGDQLLDETCPEVES